MVKRNRRSLKRNKRKNLSNTNFSIVGVNAAGMSSKLSSFENLLKTKIPQFSLFKKHTFSKKADSLQKAVRSTKFGS